MGNIIAISPPRIALACIGIMAMACSADPSDNASQITETQASGEEPTPIAWLTAENGNLVEFYDFGSGVLISESGPAYTPAIFRPQGVTSVDLVDVWRQLAPDGAVPQALVDLQNRRYHAPPTRVDRAGDDERSVEVGGEEGNEDRSADQGKATILAPVGCNNGCCDYEWLSTFLQCQGYWDYSWFLYNYGATWANLDDIAGYDGLVCSAQETSTYKLNIRGYGGTWSVPEAHWRSYYWLADVWPWCGGFCGENLRSSVNTVADQHLHTYCGAIFYDDF